ncbi:MAG: RluA family pseudouridine synthase [Syntrophomonadaceae bacterium]|nr:RluA family pseudouridine synthase [Syntrophomonadaceae bacterium]
MSELEKLMVEEEKEGERLDAFVADEIESLSRSMAKILIDAGKVLVDGVKKKPSYQVREGEVITVEVEEPRAIALEPRDIPLDILYQDTSLVVIDKPKGLVVHPAHGNWDFTLVNALLYHIRDLSGINGELRPGIVHRLDKDTSGVMVVAKNDTAHRHLAEQIKEHTIKREYTALVHGNIKEENGIIEAPIGRSHSDRKKMAVVADGRSAISHYRVVERFGNYTLVRVKLMTGRTHQIRVHFSYIRHPVVGDPVYGPDKKHLGLDSQALHASLLGFVHPVSGEYMEFTSPLPPYFEKLLKQLR